MANGGIKMRKKIIYNPASNKFENLDPDVPTITKRLNEFRRADDQLPTYDKDQGTFVKGKQKRALSDYEIIDAYKNAKEEDKKLFEPILNRIAKKPSAVDKWNAIHKSMTPKERREFYKDKKEKPKDMYDDIPKVHMPEPMQIDLKIPEKNLENNLEEERFKKLLERKEDPDIKRGLGSITYKLIKD
jgi:hypothetical protein|tara:strand:+ start:2591 stop:3151 length:561 start_codon:yes stop_codon:yes gene_type:complete